MPKARVLLLVKISTSIPSREMVVADAVNFRVARNPVNPLFRSLLPTQERCANLPTSC